MQDLLSGYEREASNVFEEEEEPNIESRLHQLMTWYVRAFRKLQSGSHFDEISIGHEGEKEVMQFINQMHDINDRLWLRKDEH